MKGPRSRVMAWACVCVGVVLLALQVASLPLYAGSSLGDHASWRLEHGRLTVKRSTVESRERFYIANNSEGLKWSPGFRFDSAADWAVTIPLWMGWVPALVVAGAGVLWWRGRGR